MHRRTSPALTQPKRDKDLLAASDSEMIAQLARRLADGSRPGVLTTVDTTGRPHARWMPIIGFGDFPCLYAIASPGSRELAHLEHQPFVNWMFGNDSQSVVINLTGRASIVTDAGLINRIWKLRTERASLLDATCQGTSFGFVLIETKVENIECNIPREAFRTLMGLLACAEADHPAWFRRA